MQELINSLMSFLSGIGLHQMLEQPLMFAMWGIVIIMLYLGVVKQFEPLLMVPIAFGALIANIPDNGMVITQAEIEVVSINEKTGEYEKTTMNDVGFLRLQLIRHKDTKQDDLERLLTKGGYTAEEISNLTDEQKALIMATPNLTRAERDALSEKEQGEYIKLLAAKEIAAVYEQVYDENGNPRKADSKSPVTRWKKSSSKSPRAACSTGLAWASSASSSRRSSSWA